MNNEEIIEYQRARIAELEDVVHRAIEDVNWMINSGQLLNRFVFDYLDKALGVGFEKSSS